MTTVIQHLGNSAPLFQALLCICPLCLHSEREGRRSGALLLPLAWTGCMLGLKFGTTLLCAVRRQDCPWAVPGKAPEQSQFGAPDFLPGKMRLRAGSAPGTHRGGCA